MGSWQCSIYTCNVTSSGSLLKHLDRSHPSSHQLCSFQLLPISVCYSLYKFAPLWCLQNLNRVICIIQWYKKKVKTIRNTNITVCHFEWRACWHQGRHFHFITFLRYPVHLSLTSSHSIFVILSSPVIICKDSWGPHEVLIVPMLAGSILGTISVEVFGKNICTHCKHCLLQGMKQILPTDNTDVLCKIINRFQILS